MATVERLTTREHHGHGGLLRLPSDGYQALIPLTRFYHPPSPHKVHPRADWVIEKVRQWLYPHLEQLGAEKLIKGIVNGTASMCTYLYPNADDEGIFLATGFMTVQFVNDDIFDSAAILKAIQATPSGQRLARDLQKLRDTPQRLADGIICTARIMENPHAYEECCEIISDLETDPYLLGATHELRAKDMTVEEYAGHKLRNSGMVYTVLFVEMAMGTFLSEEHNAIPQIRQMQQHCEKIGSLLNELFSYEKETFLENTNNLLAVLVRTEKISVYEAARRVAAMSQRHAQEVERIRIEIEAECDDDSEEDTDLGTYVADMELFGAACWFWQLQGTKRYSSKTSPFVELRLADGNSEVEADKGAR
ncbi:hypothetical protein FOBRF1_013841 [Fusarium oxysporum]